jgi:thiamine-phosphate pyrophosphorylase
MRPLLDLRLNAILDPERAGGHDLLDLARAVAAGGATLVQLRDKKSDTRAMVEKAGAIKAILAPFNIAFVVNDRIDVALAAGADGVHIGPDDMTPEDARRLLGPDAIIGVSIKPVAAAEAAPVGIVNYSGVGGVYATLSKEQKTPPIGVNGFARVAGALRRRAPALPIVGIAGIDAGNAGPVIGAGADGVAVISALSGSRDATVAARTLREVVDGMLAKRGT